MTESIYGLIVGAILVIVGYLCGIYQQKNNPIDIINEHYKDMMRLTNQFADLSTQLYNSNRNNVLNPPQVGFPSTNELIPDLDAKERASQSEAELIAENADMMGGRI